MGRPTKLLLEFLLGLVVLVWLAGAVLIWRLSQGPLSLDLLIPLAERGMSALVPDIVVRVEHTALTWGTMGRNLELRLSDTRLLSPEGRVVAVLPEATIGISASALLKGVVAPTGLELINPRLALLRQPDGAIELLDESGEDGGGDWTSLIGELTSPPDPSRMSGALSRLAITGATVTVDDRARGLRWQASQADLTLRRRAAGIAADLAFDLGQAGEPSAAPPARRPRIRAEGELKGASQDSVFTVHLDKLLPGDVVALVPALKRAGGLSTPISGRLELRLGRDWRMTGLGVDLSAAPGEIADPEYYPQPAKLQGGTFKARYDAAAKRFELEELRIDFAGPVLTVKGSGGAFDTAPRIAVEATLRNLPADDFHRLWPPPLGANARRWIIANLSHGMLEELKVEAKLAAARPGLDALDAEQVRGTLRYSGVTVNYLTPMPKVADVGGTGTFTETGMDLVITGGGIDRLRVKEGHIALTDFEKKDQWATIDFVSQGPVRDALLLIDRPPLQYPRRIGLVPADFGGDATVKLHLRFPLIDRLTVDGLELKAGAELAGFSRRDAALGQDATDGQLKIEVDQKGLEASGRASLGGVPLDIRMSQPFARTGPFLSRIQAKGRVDAAGRARLGFDTRPFVDGPVDLEIDYTERRAGEATVAVNAGLEQAQVKVSAIGWEKRPGVAMTARFEVPLKDQRPLSVRNVNLRSANAMLDAAIGLSADGKGLGRVEIARARLGRSDLRGTIERTPGGWRANLAGLSLDLEPMMKERGSPSTERPALIIAADFDRVYFAADRFLEQVRLQGDRGSKNWNNLELRAVAGRGSTVSVVLRQGANGRQTLTAATADAGAFLRAVDLLPDVVGGKLTVQGATDPQRKDGAISGTLALEEFRVRDAPVLARLLSLMSLTGILDALSGQEGLPFVRLDSRFAYADPKIEIADLRAYGGALGITAKGAIDLDASQVDIEGTVVPAYSINSLLGEIPILGDILVGEKGSGIFAATYRVRGPFDGTSVSVNPLAALTPGFLRGIFGIFDGGVGGTDTPPERQQQERHR